MNELAVVLPAYNEDENIKSLVNKWQKYQGVLLNDYGLALRIIVINDGSSDQTREIAERLEHEYSNVTLINHLHNKGLGEAVKTGISYVLKNCPNSFYLGLMDCDNTQDPKYILDMLDTQSKSGSDVVIASRYQKGAQVKGVSRFRLLTSEGARGLFSAILRVPNVQDYTCGYRLYTKQILLQASDRFGVNLIEESGFTCMAELLYKLYRCGAVFAEIPFELRYDFKRGASKMAVFKTAVNSFRLALRLRNIKENKNCVPLIIAAKDKYQFRIELFLAFLITGLACCAGFSNLLFASNDLYPAATDAMGHMAKVQYITQCLRDGVIPSWFPYWYNGATVTQYYPPLPYYLMVPIYALTENAMLTFKIDCFVMMFVGGMGVWYFCQKNIGRWGGLIAIVLYCLQPFLLGSLHIAGVIAQGPIFAATPWFLFFVLSFIKNPTRWKVLICTFLSAFLILSHAMHAFIIALSIMLVLFLFVIFKRIDFHNYIILAVSIVVSAILTAFWSIVGVTGFENPTVPYILPGVAANVTATIEWFQPKYMGVFLFYFALPILILNVFAMFISILRASKKRIYSSEKFEIPFCIVLTFFTFVFSFGKQIPGFQFLPMAYNLVPGRILSLTAVTAAIVCAYLFYIALRFTRILRLPPRLLLYLIIFSAFTLTIFLINPYKFHYPVGSYEQFGKKFETVDTSRSSYDRGRYGWYGGFSSDEASIPITYGFNLSDGWNMEGSPHNRVLWDHLLCVGSGTNDYLSKNFAFWNVRYAMLPSQYSSVIASLQEHLGFRLVNLDSNFYASDLSSSYFLIDHRDALLLGIGAPAVAMEFPFLVYEQRTKISDYSLEELEKYKLVYLCEPSVETIQEQKSIENTVTHLVDKGITVIIEPAATKSFSLFDVAASDVKLENTPTLQQQDQSPIKSTIDKIRIDEKVGYSRVLFGLDEEYYNLVQNDGRLKNSIIGTKRVGSRQVVFLGMHLSQFLKPVYARNWGVPQNNEFPECSADVTTLFEDIFRTYGVNTNFWPDPFPVKSATWNYKGVDFDYSLGAPQQMTLSVTYAPRWKATIDGKPLDVGQKENLIILDLPAGEHQVSLIYGVTKYGIMGYAISGIGLILLFFFLKYYDILSNRFARLCDSMIRFLQF